MGKASTRGCAPGCGGKAEVWKEADEDEALRLGQLAVDVRRDKMRNQFGEAFDAYVRTVRRWI